MKMKIALMASALSAAFVMSVGAAVPKHVLELPPSAENCRNSEGDFAVLKDGSVIFAYSHYVKGSGDDHDPAHIAMRISKDGGHTWSSKSEKIIENEGGMNVMCVSFLRLKDGSLALFYCRKNSEADCRPMMRVSKDEGKTWGDPVKCIGDEATDYYVLENCRVERLKSGRIIIPLSLHESKNGKIHDWRGKLVCTYSDDDGATWRLNGTPFSTFDEKGNRISTQEPGIVQLKDGRLLMYARTDTGRQWFYYSSDDGITWTKGEPGTLWGPLSPATVKCLSNGDLFAVWNDHESHPEFVKQGPSWAKGSRRPISVAISRDEGKTWINRRTLDDNPDGWYCYFGVLEHKGNLLLGYCAEKMLRHARLTLLPIDWLYGHTYYVDAAGDDAASGTSPATAWKTPDRAFKTELGPGDRVLFRSGCKWRIDDTMKVNAKGVEEDPVLISSYGAGAKPEFLASVDGTRPGFWASAGDGLWKANVSGKTDVGNIVCVKKGANPDKPVCGWKRWKTQDLVNEGDYYHDLNTGVVWFRSAVDPALVYDRMELCRRIHHMNVGRTTWLQVKGLSFLYTGAHGIIGAPVQHLLIQGNTFGWIGGSLLGMWPDGRGGKRPVRYGNGIEFWATGHNFDIRLDSNFFYEVYDTAMTNQGDSSGVLENMVICSNRTVNCEQSYEIWFTSTNYFVKSIELFGNRFEEAGYGWSHAQRPDKNATHLLAYSFDSKAGSIYYHDNYLGRTKQCMFWWFSWPTIKYVRLDHNTYVQPGVNADTWHGLFHWRTDKRDCQPTWEDYRRITGYDANSRLLTPPENDPEVCKYLTAHSRNWFALGNGDFEDVSASSTGAFSGWSFTDRKSSTKCRAVADSDMKHGGQYALRIDSVAGENIQIARNVNLHDRVFKPGRTYRLSGYIRHVSGPRSWSFDFGVFTESLKCLHGRGFNAEGDDWKFISDEFKLPEGGSIIRIMLNAANGASGLFDDIHLEEQRDDGSWHDVISAGY